MNGYSIILFFSNNHAMWAAKLMKKLSIDRKIIPIPRKMSSDCGYCVKVKTIDVKAVELLMKEAGVEYHRIENL